MKIARSTNIQSGVAAVGRRYIFTIALPEAEECRLIIYRPGTDEVLGDFLMDESYRIGDIFCAEITGMNVKSFEYVYEADGKAYVDPCCRAVAGNQRWGKGEAVLRGRFRVMEPKQQLCRTGRIAMEEMFLYRFHVRGFTMDSSARVSDNGTFRGIEQKIPYLKSIGVNAVELMPVYEFDESAVITRNGHTRKMPEPWVNYWGYGSKSYYFAPKNSYAAGDDSTAEFEHLVDRLHQESIAVILDFCFDAEVSAEQMTAILRSWVINYGVDGFRVNADRCPVSYLVKDPVLADCYLLAENLDGCQAEDKAARLGFANDYFAHTARRYMLGLAPSGEEFFEMFRYHYKSFGRINYAASNNGLTLRDVFSYNRKHNENNGEGNRDGAEDTCSCNCGVEGEAVSEAVLNLRMQMIKNMLCITFLANGVPMVQAGDEFGHTAKGNNNPYCHDNELNWLNWGDLEKYSELTEFFGQLVDLWKSYRAFHQTEPLSERDVKMYGCPAYSVHGSEPWSRGSDQGVAGILYYGRYFDGPSLYVAFNTEVESAQMQIPLLPERSGWKVLLQTSNEKAEQLDDETFLIPARSIVIMTSLESETGENE